MTNLSFRDLEHLSAYLDGQLAQAERTCLDTRLAADPNLSAALDELRAARAILRRTPPRRAPRNFTLTPKMAGIRPPVPRAVPVFRFASAITTLVLFLSFAGNLLGSFTMAAAPKAAESPGLGGGYGGGPAENVSVPAPASAEDMAPTPTAQALALMAPQATLQPEATAAGLETARTLEQPVEQPPETRLGDTPAALEAEKTFTLSPPQIALLVLAVGLGGAAFLVRWLNERAFHRRGRSEKQ